MEPGLLERLEERFFPGEQEPVRPGQMVSGQSHWAMGRRIGMSLSPPERELPPHTRDYVELAYQCRGRAALRVNDRSVELEEGELLLLGQNALLERPAQEPESRTVCFLIKPELLGDILRFLGSEQTPLREFILRTLGQENPYGYLHFRVSGVRPVENLMENLILHLLDSPTSRRAIPMYTLGLLFAQLLDQTERLVIGIREQQAILRVLQYVEANYPHANLTDIARELYCDVSWLSREICRRTGRTFTELVQERRLNQAAWLLRNTRQKVSDIAHAVGYENISYFHRIFAGRFGCTPKKYRDSQS